jgi:hypothetical protein
VVPHRAGRRLCLQYGWRIRMAVNMKLPGLQEQLRSLGVSTLVNKNAHPELIRTLHYLLQPVRGYSDECGSLT